LSFGCVESLFVIGYVLNQLFNARNIMKQKSILCYGDSNTWGYIPQTDHSLPKARYPRAVRWTGVLQTLLGQNFHVIEEGLNSRTTNLNYAIPPERNGKTYLSPCLYSHAPLDLVIIGLGGNDTKTYFNRTAEQITSGLEELVDIIQTSSYGVDLLDAPQILIMSCVIPYEFIEEVRDEQGVKFMQGAYLKSKELVNQYKQLALNKKCHFVDLSKNVIPSQIDGVHYDEIAHQQCAKILFEKINEIL
jgi:lysophospholipase L1-like esterase